MILKRELDLIEISRSCSFLPQFSELYGNRNDESTHSNEMDNLFWEEITRNHTHLDLLAHMGITPLEYTLLDSQETIGRSPPERGISIVWYPFHQTGSKFTRIRILPALPPPKSNPNYVFIENTNTNPCRDIPGWFSQNNFLDMPIVP